MRVSRRGFVAGAVVLPWAVRAMAVGSSVQPRWVLLGTDAGKGIYRAAWNATTGEMGVPELAIEAARPDFFARHPRLPVMYSVNSVGGGKGAVSAFHLAPATAELTVINTVDAHGDGPCFVALHPTGRALYVANYSAGSFAAIAIAEDGSLGAAMTVLDCRAEKVCGAVGPVADRQDASHLHCTTVSPDGAHVVLCDLGTDSLLVFALDTSTGAVVGPPMRVSARRGSGPRHVAFHPNGRWLYCVHELDATIDRYAWNHGAPVLEASSVTSALAKGASHKGVTGCELVISPDGKFAYTCNRGVDDVVVYAIAADGALRELQRFPSGGKVPRIFAFDPSRRWLVVCNQSAPGTVAVFRHDPVTAKVDPTPKVFAAETPMFAEWV